MHSSSDIKSFYSKLHSNSEIDEAIMFTLISLKEYLNCDISFYEKRNENFTILKRLTTDQNKYDSLHENKSGNSYKYSQIFNLDSNEFIEFYSNQEIVITENIELFILFLKEKIQKDKLIKNNELTYSFNQKHQKRLQLLENFLKNTKDAIQVTDISGQLIYLNKEASERLGIETDRVQDYRVSDFEPSFKNKKVWEDHLEIVRKSGTFTIESYNTNIKTKERIAVELVITIQAIEGNEYVIAASRNIEERIKRRIELEKAKQKAEENAKFKDEFIAKISHDIRTPLNGILGLSRELAKNELTDEIKEKIKHIRASGKYLSQVFNDILDQYKLNSIQLNPKYKEHHDSSNLNSVFNDKKILIVEDNIINRIVAKSSLSEFNCEIFECENGQEAIDFLTNNSQIIDLILMDIQMPILDGFQTSTYIRNELNLSIPIIALTANAFHLDANQYTKYGITDCIFKPYNENHFIEKIQFYLDKSKLRHYSLDYLRKITYNDEEILNEIIELFYNSISEEIDKITSQLLENNYVDFKKTIHKLKPNIFNFRIENEFENIEYLNAINEDEFKSEESILITKHLCNSLKSVKEEIHIDFILR